MQPLPNLMCPRCGQPNDCAAARTGSFATPCWCASVTIAAELLESLPPEDRGRACLCPRCAAGTPPPSR